MKVWFRGDTSII